MNDNTEGRHWALSGQEYYATRALMGIVSTFETELQILQKRLKSVPYGWRDAKMIAAVADSLLIRILKTVPPKKLAQIQQEISHTHVEINVTRDYTGKSKEQFTYVPNKALEWLEDKVLDTECTMCDMDKSEAKRCPVRKNIEALYMYDFPEKESCCPLAQMHIAGDPRHGH